MNTNAMQVVRHILERRILILKQVLLGFNLMLERGDLLLDLRAVGVKNLFNDARLEFSLLKWKLHLDVRHIAFG